MTKHTYQTNRRTLRAGISGQPRPTTFNAIRHACVTAACVQELLRHAPCVPAQADASADVSTPATASRGLQHKGAV